MIADVVRAACAALEAAGLSPVYPRRMSAVDRSEGVVVRATPTVVRAEYIDGTVDLSCTLTAWCKFRGVERAMGAAEDAMEALWGSVLDAGGTPVALSQMGSGPSESELTDSGFSVWAISARADWTERPRRA